MTHVELISEFAEKAGLTKKDAKECLGVLEDIVYGHISDDKGVTLFNGMTVTRGYLNEREGRNPSTGEPIMIAGRYVPKVKFGTKAKAAANA